MADRVVRAVSDGPRRRIGFGAGLGLLTVVVALIASGFFVASPSAHTVRAKAAASTQTTGQQTAGQASGAKQPAGQSTAQQSAQKPAAQPSSGQRSSQEATPHLSQSQINSDVTALLSKMTVAEKFGQLEMAAPDGPNGTPGDLINQAQNGQIGSVLDLVGVKNINQVQRAALQSRLGIPLIFGLDVIHGYKTMFPVPLGEAASWDPSLVENDESVSASEATADGIKWTFNPMVDISRDARWGRVVEGAGEDPFLGSAIAAAKVKGYQGDNFAAPDKMASTIKHFGAYGAPVAGREYNTVDMSTQQLAQRLPAALQGGRRRRRGDGDGLVQLAQRRPEHGQPVPAQDDPAQRVGLQGHHDQRLPGGPGARGVRLRLRRSRRGATGTDRRARHRDGGAGRPVERVLDLREQRAAAARRHTRSR